MASTTSGPRNTRQAAGVWTSSSLLEQAARLLNNVFVRFKGAVWFFWEQLDFHCIAWHLQLIGQEIRRRESGAATSRLRPVQRIRAIPNSFEDSNGNIWFFWQQT